MKSPTSRKRREKWGTLVFGNRGEVGHPPSISKIGSAALCQRIQYLQWIRSLCRHHIPGGRSNVEQREKVETESGVQAACSSSNALPHDERLTIHRLSCAQAILGNLHILQQ